MRFWTLKYVHHVMEGIDFAKLLTENPQYEDGKPLLDALEGYCMHKFTETEKTEIEKTIAYF